MWMEVSGTSMRLTPAATDALASPFASPVAARCVATRELEQAVSMPMQGPAGTSLLCIVVLTPDTDELLLTVFASSWLEAVLSGAPNRDATQGKAATCCCMAWATIKHEALLAVRVRTLEAEGVGDAADEEVQAGAGEHGDAGRHRQLLQQQLVLLPHAAHIHARRRRCHLCARRQRILQTEVSMTMITEGAD